MTDNIIQHPQMSVACRRRGLQLVAAYDAAELRVQKARSPRARAAADKALDRICHAMLDNIGNMFGACMVEHGVAKWADKPGGAIVTISDDVDRVAKALAAFDALKRETPA